MRTMRSPLKENEQEIPDSILKDLEAIGSFDAFAKRVPLRSELRRETPGVLCTF